LNFTGLDGILNLFQPAPAGADANRT
jgi:hypothetical protein